MQAPPLVFCGGEFGEDIHQLVKQNTRNPRRDTCSASKEPLFEDRFSQIGVIQIAGIFRSICQARCVTA